VPRQAEIEEEDIGGMRAGTVNSQLTVVHRRDLHSLGAEDALDQPARHDVVIDNQEGAGHDSFAIARPPYFWRRDPSGRAWHSLAEGRMHGKTGLSATASFGLATARNSHNRFPISSDEQSERPSRLTPYQYKNARSIQ
jgi:hypothetical protein